MATPDTAFSHLGFGLGLRIPHYAHIFEQRPKVDWFEIISENFMDTGGRPRRNLERIRAQYPIVMHGVAMSIGTVDPLNSEYLTKLKQLAHEIEPAWISDHLCWTGTAHKNTHDLLPVPYTEEALKHIVDRIQQVQDFLKRPIALENPSTYLEFKTSHIPEAEFIAQMAKRSGCQLLLDVNNVYVSCYNHRLDAKAYIDALPLDRVIQIHLSGHSNMGTHIIDTHDDHVVDEVWALYQYVVRTAGRVPNTMVEWDDNIPAWEVLVAELDKAKAAAAHAKNGAPLPNLAEENPRYVPNIVTPLHDAQTTMQEAILRGTAHDSAPDAWIRAKERFAPAEQLAVYVNAYRYRLYDVTAEDYPVLKYYLGEAAFERLIDDFIERAPSTHFNVARYGAGLPAYVATHAAGDAFACELATLENAIAQLADAAETAPLTPEQMAGMTPEALMETRLHPRAALQLFAFDHTVNRYYIAVKEEASPQLPLAPEKSFVAVFRHEDVMWRMELAGDEYRLLSNLFAGAPIGEALAGLEESSAMKLSEYFSRWMRNGLLAVAEYVDEPTLRSIA
jgi:uncharacterized protein (UPF0276 family)